MFIATIVASSPPCPVEADVNDVPTFDASLPCAHSPPVVSRNALSCSAAAPNRVGLPSAIPSAHSRSSREATVSYGLFSTHSFQRRLPSIASAGARSATGRTRTSAPASRAPSARASARAATLPVAE